MQERFDGAGTREVEEDTVLVLLELGCHFEEGKDQAAGCAWANAVCCRVCVRKARCRT